MGQRYGMGIRAATAEDAGELVELLAAAGRPLAPSVLAGRIEALRRGPGTVLLAVEWGPPSGLVAASWTPTLDHDLPVAGVSALLVGPEDRRRGIGRLLLKAVSQAARSAGCGEIRVTASGGDASLDAFCTATGFTRHGATYARALRKKA